MLNGDIARKKTFHSFKFWLSPFGNYLNSLCYLKMNSKTLQKYHSPGTHCKKGLLVTTNKNFDTMVCNIAHNVCGSQESINGHQDQLQ